MKFRLLATVALIGLAGALGVPRTAEAQTATDQQAAPAPAPAPAPSTAMDLGNGISMSGHVEAGTSINPDSPSNNINFGQTFTDQANTFRMNQLMLNVERDLDPKNAGWQWGFKFTGMYGTDARVTHFLGEFDRITHSPYQFDIVEADVQAHLPLYGGGTDAKLGQYPTPLGAEVIDATGNQFYSHSYIFNYGLPFKHTGLLTTTHVNDTIDLWLGLDTGVNNSIGEKGMANNYFPKFLLGFGLNGLMDGNLTILALSHLGPENPRFTEFTNTVTDQPLGGGPAGCTAFTVAGACGGMLVPGANKEFREYYDIVTTYKVNDSLTATNELNYVHDDLAGASAGGDAQYFAYTLNDQWTVGARGEVFADQGKPANGPLFFGGFACVATESLDYDNGARGLAPFLGYCGAGKNYSVTYAAITIGGTYKPSISDKFNVMIRPEARWDGVIGGSSGVKPFDVNGKGVGTKTSQVTLAVDLIAGF